MKQSKAMKAVAKIEARNPLDDDAYTGNDDQINDLKDLVRELAANLSDCTLQMAQARKLINDGEFEDVLDAACEILVIMREP